MSTSERDVTKNYMNIYTSKEMVEAHFFRLHFVPEEPGISQRIGTYVWHMCHSRLLEHHMM